METSMDINALSQLLNQRIWYLTKFAKFVKHVLTHRNHQIEVSSVKLDFSGAASQVFVRKIASYAFSHNVQEITIKSRPKKQYQFPLCLFSSQSLKRFTLINDHSCWTCITPKTPWDFPAITTLHLSDITLCDNHTEKSVDLFSKCVNLKNLTLERFSIGFVEVLDIITPRLSNLKLIYGRSSRGINLIAPQLENLTIEDCSIEYMNVPPGLSSLCYSGRGYPPWQLFNDGFHSLNKASICLANYCPYNGYKEEDARKTINMLQQLHSARYLELGTEIIECLSLFPDLVSQHPSPFSNLVSLTIKHSIIRNDAYKVKLSAEVKNFLPSATTFIMGLPEEQALEIGTHMKELQALIEKGSTIFEKKEKAKPVFENIISIIWKKERIRSLLDKLGKKERTEVEACFSRQIENEKAQRACLLRQIEYSKEDNIVFDKLLSDYEIRMSSYPVSALCREQHIQGC